jgi:hypothetical protein
VTWTPLILFAAQFSLIFLLGLQSLVVNNGYVAQAFLISCLIGMGNLVAFKLVPDAGIWDAVGYLMGGPLGIVCSIKFFAWWRAQKVGKGV